MPDFTCRDCGTSFSLPQQILDRYPGWTPGQCRSCRDDGSRSSRKQAVASTGKLGRRDPSNGDPTTGVFTDGSAVPNPGPGGWGAVYVVDNEIVGELHGHDPATTNNRMELLAIIEGIELVPKGTSQVIYSDSNLAVRTVNEWAPMWEARGWKRKSGPVENLDLVKTLMAKLRARPELEVRWIKAHVGFRWNEYADELANRWRGGR